MPTAGLPTEPLCAIRTHRGSSEEYTHAKEAAAADLATLQKQLTGGEVDPGCEGVVARRYWPENAVLRRDVAVFFSELSDMVSSELSSMVELPDAATVKASLFSWATETMTSTTSSISRALEAAAPVIVLAKTVVSDAALAEAQAALAEAQVTAVNEGLEPLHEELVAPTESAEQAVSLVEEVTPTAEEAQLPVAVPVATLQRNGIARFLRSLLLLSALGAGAAVAVHHREAIAGEVSKRVAQLQGIRPKAPSAKPVGTAEASADASPALAEWPAAVVPAEAPAQPAAASGAAL